MSRALRMTDAQLAAYVAKHVQRPPEDSSRPLLPARGAPYPTGAGANGVAHGVITWFEPAGSDGEPNKYKNKSTDGYASKREAKRAAELKLMQEAGQIRNLREQASYLLIPKQEGERACSYVADFVYEEWGPFETERGYIVEPGRTVVEDCKGMRTDVYKIKKKLMLMVHGIRIRET